MIRFFLTLFGVMIIFRYFLMRAIRATVWSKPLYAPSRVKRSSKKSNGLTNFTCRLHERLSTGLDNGKNGIMAKMTRNNGKIEQFPFFISIRINEKWNN